ncbi:hypothetical protein RND71_044021 [Anisodus tanguticus]|uniref:Tubby C-terminal domain-containing protein n=1 Tax=Anisodus tanguticus TaxID=243964 RepID=A0AAE1UTI7_9SOLA|nr:hypothetical protein RND71_044021 [Anisodus tanguticus]
MLEYFFSIEELKALDDMIPESTKRKREEEKSDDDSSTNNNDGIMTKSGSSNKVTIALANGNVLKIPMESFQRDVDQCNITEQLAKSNAWKSVDEKQRKSKGKKGSKKKRVSKPDIMVEVHKRLSIMNEEEEDDCGISIKVDAPTPMPSNAPSTKNSPQNKVLEDGAIKKIFFIEFFRMLLLHSLNKVQPNSDDYNQNSLVSNYTMKELIMYNKAPIWNELSHVYQLDFGGRVTQESAKNFQIEFEDKQVLQFGRIDVNAYTLDFQKPFCALQALSTALANVTQRLK